MSVHKKSKNNRDVEASSDQGKPELDGKTTLSEKVTPELGTGETTTAPAQPAQAAEADARPMVRTAELPTQPAAALLKEMSTEPSHAETDSTTAQQQRYELHGEHLSGSPVSPISSNAQDVGFSRRDTYDDPRLVQNPWTHDDAPRR